MAISKFYLKEFYGLEGLTVEDVLWDREGRRRAEILNLEAQMFPQMAIERTVKPMEKQAQWQQGYCPWDLAPVELRRRLRQELGFEELIEQLQGGWEWTKHDLTGYAAKARALASEIKVALNFTISDRVSDVQIVHQLLLQLGLRMRFCRWSRTVEGYLGEKLRVYGLDGEHWQMVSEILERRRLKREVLHAASGEGLKRNSEAGSPWFITPINQGGDPTPYVPKNGFGAGDWLTVEALADVRQMWRSSETPEEWDWIRANVPAEVLMKAII